MRDLDSKLFKRLTIDMKFTINHVTLCRYTELLLQ